MVALHLLKAFQTCLQTWLSPVVPAEQTLSFVFVQTKAGQQTVAAPTSPRAPYAAAADSLLLHRLTL